MVEVAQRLKNQGHDILYWVHSLPEAILDKTKFPSTIFHDLSDALALKSPAGMRIDFAPPSADLLRRLRDAEVTVLTMMNKKFEYLSLEERKHFYYHLVGYWHEVILRFKPEAIIYGVTPHTVYDFVIYALAKVLGIKTIMFDWTRVRDRLLIMNDFLEGNLELRFAMRATAGRDFSVDDLDPDIKHYYAEQRDLEFDATPRDTTVLVGKYRGINRMLLKLKVIFSSLFSLKIGTALFWRVARLFRGDLQKEYGRWQTKPDFSRKFVYVPLNYQPECSTCPLGEVFVDQILMIETLAAALPKDWIIYVKEHPFQWLPRGPIYFSYRYRGYYEAIAKLPNVCLVSANTDTFSLINHAQAVATVTGSAGWEAILRSKPVLVFGYPWYRDCHGVFMVRDAQSAKDVLDKIKDGWQLDQKEIIRYLYNFGKVSFPGYLDAFGKETYQMDAQQNIANIFNALVGELEKKD